MNEFNHYFVRANDIENTKQFCVGWVSVNGKVPIHMGPAGHPPRPRCYIGFPPNAATVHGGVVDRSAFLAADPDTFCKRFETLSIGFLRRYPRELSRYQLLLKDPDNLTMELNFLLH
jgi:hypothetical protein